MIVQTSNLIASEARWRGRQENSWKHVGQVAWCAQWQTRQKQGLKQGRRPGLTLENFLWPLLMCHGMHAPLLLWTCTHARMHMCIFVRAHTQTKSKNTIRYLKKKIPSRVNFPVLRVTLKWSNVRLSLSHNEDKLAKQTFLWSTAGPLSLLFDLSHSSVKKPKFRLFLVQKPGHSIFVQKSNDTEGLFSCC